MKISTKFLLFLSLLASAMAAPKAEPEADPTTKESFFKKIAVRVARYVSFFCRVSDAARRDFYRLGPMSPWLEENR